MSDAVPLPEREAFSATLQAYVAAKNAGSRLEDKRSAHAPWPERNEYTAYRRWSFEVWELRGAADTWSEQLRERYEDQPVFALVSGLIAGSFEPIAALCEELTLPCLFPITPLPGGEYPCFRFGAWARSRGLGVAHPRVQLQAYFALLQLGDAVMHVRQHLVREYVLETIEHTAYRSLVTAGLPRLSLAAGQRFASKGASVTRIAPGHGAAPPGWRVP